MRWDTSGADLGMLQENKVGSDTSGFRRAPRVGLEGGHVYCCAGVHGQGTCSGQAGLMAGAEVS